MDILKILGAILLLVAIYVAGRVILVLGFLLLGLIWYTLPVTLGLIFSIIAFSSGQDNVGVIILLAIFPSMHFWLKNDNYARLTLWRQCPSCKKWAGKINSFKTVNSSWETEEEIKLDHYDSDRNFIGSTDTGKYKTRYRNSTDKYLELACTSCSKTWKGETVFMRLSSFFDW